MFTTGKTMGAWHNKENGMAIERVKGKLDWHEGEKNVAEIHLKGKAQETECGFFMVRKQ